MVKHLRILYLQCLNIGDAVIGTGLVEALSGDGVDIEVLTRRGSASIYANNPSVAKVHTAEFPMGTNWKFTIGDAARLFMHLNGLRGRRYDAAVGVTGDLRENAMGWFVSGGKACGPQFSADNPFLRVGHSGLTGLLHRKVECPADRNNIYDIVRDVSVAMGARKPARQRVYHSSSREPILNDRTGRAIGLHPLSGGACRRWPIENWRQLASTLRAGGFPVVLLGAPGERDWLNENFNGLIGNGVEIATGSVEEFFVQLSKLRLLIGLDSFSIHAAYAVDTPAVMICGPQPSNFFAPPETQVVKAVDGVACYPCFNRPTCQGSPDEFLCMRRISVEAVIAAMERLDVRLG